MRTIGIKLADGSFYPVLEEFSNSEKQLDLTTAHNNQTKVMVDLYRSKNCSMEDAEYVDSLQIENLVAHPNGEPNISFTVAIDENNKLSAKIKDCETGNQSKTTITLVSRTIEERLTTDEYKISDSKDKPKVRRLGFLAKAEKLRENENQEEHENNTIIAFTPAADDEINKQKKLELIDDVVIPNDNTEDTDEKVFWPDETDVTQVIEDENPKEKNENTEVVQEIELNEISEEKVDIQEVIEPQEEPKTENETIEENTVELNSTIQDDGDDEISDDEELLELNFDFPGDDSKEILENAAKDFNQVSDEMDEMPENFFDTENSLEKSDLENEFETTIDDNDSGKYFDNDFGTISDEKEKGDSDFLDDLDENPFEEEDSPFDLNSLDDNSLDDFSLDDNSFAANSVSNSDSSAGKGPLSFTGLYDKETELGQSTEDEKIKKKTKVPVIICIICAIICVIATLLILFIVPSKYNLLHKGNSPKETTEITTEESAAPLVEVQEIETKVEEEPKHEEIEPEPEPIAPPAQEEEVVVVEQAELVVPEQPPVTPEKPKDIDYKIKWGDTLWDIADTYYKNPWRYKYIAKFNHIKDPDYIISGTYITIPAE